MSDVKYPSNRHKDLRRRYAGRWISRQRLAYKQGKLSRKQIESLEQLPGWEWEVTSPARGKKKRLLEMARKGEPRPNQKKTRLGKGLSHYIDKNSKTYDSAFDKVIRKLVPSWFVNAATEKKEELLGMAQRGEPRPSTREKTRLGNVLMSYVCKSHGAYDPEFDKAIRELAPPYWFNKVGEKKKELLAMAHKGEPRPVSKKTVRGVDLVRYTGKKTEPMIRNLIKKLESWLLRGLSVPQIRVGSNFLEWLKKGHPDQFFEPDWDKL